MLFGSIVEKIVALFNVFDFKKHSFLPFLQGPNLQRENWCYLGNPKMRGQSFKPFKLVYTNSKYD